MLTKPDAVSSVNDTKVRYVGRDLRLLLWITVITLIASAAYCAVTAIHYLLSS